jgi:hypothetical protein
MEEFKQLNQLIEMDEKHMLMGAVCGSIPSLEGMHKYLSDEVLNDGVPEEIKGQFNIAKNMALYTYYFYALAPEVHLKTYTIIERAIKLKAKPKKRLMLKALMKLAFNEGWVTDSGFRHINDPDANNQWCNIMLNLIPDMRNSQAHGSDFLVGDCLHHISTCTDFINQLFPNEKST